MLGEYEILLHEKSSLLPGGHDGGELSQLPEDWQVLEADPSR